MGAPSWNAEGRGDEYAQYLAECIKWTRGDYGAARVHFSEALGIDVITESAGRSLLSRYKKPAPSRVMGTVANETADRLYVDRQPEVEFSANYGGGGVEKVAFIPDCHHDQADPVAYPLAVEAIRVFAPDTLVLLGDFGDFSSLSSHGRNPERAEHFAAEVAQLNVEFDKLDTIKVTRRVKCEGNHLFRAKRYVMDRAPELFGMLDPVELFHFRDRGVEFIPYREFGHVGRLLFSHEVGYCGLNAASKSRDETNSNVIVGHAHNATIAYRGDALGDCHVGVCAGWLGDPSRIKYMHKSSVLRNWQHGFSIAYVERDTGNCHVHFIPIVKGRCVVEGRVIEARKAA